MLVSFGYTGLPFWPQGRHYTAYFAHAAGIADGNPVEVYGYTVGHVDAIELDVAGQAAKVGFTVDRKIRVGDQSVVAIKTDTVLGQRSIELTPRGSGLMTLIPLARTNTPYTLNNALQDLGHNVGELDHPKFVEALHTLTAAMRDATPQVHAALEGITALASSVNARDDKVRQLLRHAASLSHVVAERAGQINQLITDGNAQITGNFSLDEAQTLANQLKNGSLPLSFQVQSEDQISPTLGSNYLKIGLLTGLVGLLLVVVYSLLQYRVLGLVTVSSLVVAGVLTYLLLLIASWRYGYRLSLAGVAGIIIGIGMTADSFVVYFERIKDEIREGRSFRSAVPRGWASARRTRGSVRPVARPCASRSRSTPTSCRSGTRTA